MTINIFRPKEPKDYFCVTGVLIAFSLITSVARRKLFKINVFRDIKLKSLSIEYIIHFTSWFLVWGITYSISKQTLISHKKTSNLDPYSELMKCHNKTDEELFQELKKCKNLTSLDLARHYKITTPTLMRLAKGYKNLVSESGGSFKKED